ncbi:Ig-like domain-containing protein [Cytobacillus pseudoceanisediminis]
MAKKKAIKLAAASAVAASAFVAAAPAQTDAASNVAVEVSKAVTQMKKAYHTYSDVTAQGKFAPIADVYKEYNAAKKAYANAKALVNKAGGADKDKHLAALEDTYAEYIAKRVITYIDAYNYATTLQDKQIALEEALKNKDWDAAEKQYHAISYELKTRTVILDRVYGKSTRELLRGSFKADAQAARDSIQNEVSVKIYFDKAEGLLNDGKLEEAKAAMDHVADYVAKLDKDTDFGAALLAKVAAAKEKYEELSVPAVKSVSANNLKTIEVTFNKNLDGIEAATSADNFSLVDNKGNKIEVASVSVKGEKAWVTLTNKATNQQTATLTVNKAVFGSEVKSNEFTFFDATVPVAQELKLIAPNKFKIIFSEPVETAGPVEIANGVYGVSKVTADGTNEVLVELSASSLAEGTYAIKTSGFKDFAGYTALNKEFSLTYVKDTSKPTASIKSATQSQVVVEFSKPVQIKGGGDLTADYFYHTFSSYKPTKVEVSADKSTYTLTFGNNPFPEGTSTLVVNADANSKPIVDGWGNEMAGDVELSVSVSADKTAPVVSKTEVVTEKQLKLYFSEDVNKGDAEKAANYVFKDADGKVVNPTGIKYSADAKKGLYVATVDFGSDLKGAYTVEVKDIKDLALVNNKIQTVTLSFNVADLTGPDLSKVTATGVEGTTGTADFIYVTFPEKMSTTGSYSILNKDNYLVGGAKLSADDKVELFGDTNKVKITLADKAKQVVESGSYVVTVGRVADASGNASTALSQQVVVSKNTAPKVTAVKTVDEKTITITVDQPLKTLVADGVEVTKGGVKGTLAAISSTVKDGVTTITGTLKAEQQLTNSADTTIEVAIIGGKLESETGSFVEATTVKADAVKDGFAPSLKTVDGKAVVAQTAKGTVSLTFTETLKLHSLAASDLIVVDKEGKTLVPGVDFTVSSSTSNLSVELAGNYANYTGDLNIVSKDKVTYITDTADNAVKPFTSVKVTLDNTAPTVAGVTEGGLYTSDVTPTFTGTALLDDKAFISGTAVTTEGVHKLVVTGNNGVSTTVNFTIDKTKPVVDDADAVDGTSLTITFSEVVKKSVAETLTNYVLTTADDTDNSTITGASLAEDGKTLTITASGAKLLATDTISISNIEDIAGNVIVTVPAQALTVE